MDKICPTCNREFAGAQALTKCPEDDTLLAARPSDPHVGSEVASQYRVVDFVGKGGMGTVYRAEKRQDGSSVAVKFLHRHLISEPSAVKRFQQECHAARAINHHTIAAVLDYGLTENAEPYIVMEFIDGSTVAELLQEKKLLPVGDVVEIARQICAALTIAHAKGIVHRDLKLSNIILEKSDGPLQVRLLDFGIAKLLPEQGETFMKVTMTGQRLRRQSRTLALARKSFVRWCSDLVPCRMILTRPWTARFLWMMAMDC